MITLICIAALLIGSAGVAVTIILDRRHYRGGKK
jgi:hypothetical protein